MTAGTVPTPSMLPPDAALSVQLPEGPGAVRETLKIMRQLVRMNKRDPAVRHMAATIISGLPSKAWRSEIDTVFYWVQHNIHFIFDTTDMEVLQTPQETLRTMIGDCDDISLLLATLLESIGHPTGFVALGKTANSLEHVITITMDGARWLPLDASVSDMPSGWFPPDARRLLTIYNG